MYLPGNSIIQNMSEKHGKLSTERDVYSFLFVLLLTALIYKEKQKEKGLQNDAEYRLFLLRLTDERGEIPFCSNLTLHLD